MDRIFIGNAILITGTTGGGVSRHLSDVIVATAHRPDAVKITEIGPASEHAIRK